MNSAERLSISIAIACFVFISLALYLIENAPATGYEISIYTSTPPLVWIFLIGSIAGGIGIMIMAALSGNKNNFWLVGFFILILNNFIILSLHALRGYYYYGGGDSMAHLSWIKNLVEIGYLDRNNFYPAIHILGAEISEICNIPPHTLVKYVPAFLSILFLMLCTYLLAKSSFLNRGQVLLASVASFVLFFNNLHLQVYPHTLSVLLYPLLIYLYFRRLEKSSWQFNFLFILVLIALPYTHPSGSLVMIIILIALEFTKVTYSKIYDYQSMNKISITPILISSITFFMWISSFALFGTKISSLHTSIFEPYQSTHFVSLMETAARLEWIEVIEYNLKMYGDTLIFMILSTIASAMIIKAIYKKEKSKRYLLMLFTFFLITLPLEYYFFIVVASETAGRMLNLMYMMTVAPVLVGFVLYELFKNKKRTNAIIAIGLILLLTSGLSILSVYNSPWTFSASWHVTDMEMRGCNWFSKNSNSTLEFDAMGQNTFLLSGIKGLIPEHFNYSYHETLGESLAQDSYAVINERCKMANAEPMVAKTQINIRSGWGFDKADFDKLGNDMSVAKLYSNGEFDTFLGYSSNPSAVLR